MKTTYVCDCCGLCCQRLIVEANVVDVLREPRIETERPLGRRADSLSVLEACWIVALPGRPCPFLTSERRCGIYPTRPHDCVAFIAGSAKCQQLREECGLPALASVPAIDEMLGEIQAELLDEQKAEPIESA
jgi:Fe-S-cluster containining protein